MFKPTPTALSRLLLAGCVALFGLAREAAADQICTMQLGVQVCSQGQVIEDQTMTPLFTSPNPGTVSDAQSQAFQGAVPMTVGTAYTAQRSIGVNCTGAGTITAVFNDGSTLSVPVGVGWQTFPFAVTKVSASTGTCIYVNLK